MLAYFHMLTFYSTRTAMKRPQGRLPRRDEVQDYIVLSGEHLYNVNFTALVAQHRNTNAALTICAAAVALDTPALSGVEGAGLGLLILSGKRKESHTSNIHQRRKYGSVMSFEGTALAKALKWPPFRYLDY